MRTFMFFIGLLVMTASANAQAVWLSYSYGVSPDKEKVFAATIDKFTKTEAFKKFNGTMIFTLNAFNGSNVETHGLQVIYKSMEDYENLMGEIRNDPDFIAFRKGLSQHSSFENEALFQWVAGFGQAASTGNRAYLAQFNMVTDPMGYVGAISSNMGKPFMKDMPGGFDIWQSLAGGAPGLTHVVVYNYDKLSDGFNFVNNSIKNPEFTNFIGSLSKYRKPLAQTATYGLKTYGPLSPADMRQ